MVAAAVAAVESAARRDMAEPGRSARGRQAQGQRTGVAQGAGADGGGGAQGPSPRPHPPPQGMAYPQRMGLPGAGFQHHPPPPPPPPQQAFFPGSASLFEQLDKRVMVGEPCRVPFS